MVVVVLKLIIRTSAKPRQQRSHWGLRVNQDAYFSLLTHTKQLLLVTFCNMLAGIEVGFWADGRTNGRTDERTDERTDGQTDVEVEIFIQIQSHFLHRTFLSQNSRKERRKLEKMQSKYIL